jgi:hypothetical protein
MNEQIMAKRALGRKRWERRFAGHSAPVKRTRHHHRATAMQRLEGPSWRTFGGSRFAFAFDWLAGLFVPTIPTPKPPKPLMPLTMESMRTKDRSKYTPHFGGGQYHERRSGRRGEQS